MAVELHEEAGGKILVIKVTGKLTKADYEAFVPTVDRLIKQHGKVRMLVQMHDFHGWSMGALWEDIKFDVKHFTHIERLALVGDRKWEATMAVFCKPFTTAKIRYFDEAQADEAFAWIHEGVVQAVGPRPTTPTGPTACCGPGRSKPLPACPMPAADSAVVLLRMQNRRA